MFKKKINIFFSIAKQILFAVFCFLISKSYSQNYFQQRVDYKIDVKLDDVKHELTASETIVYTNNSTSDLAYIYFHLWPNAYKDLNTAFAKQLLENGDSKFYFSKDEDKGYIDQLDFRVNGTSAMLIPDAQNNDIAKLVLNEPLKPGAKITITTPFHVKIPNGMFSRMGHEKQQYQITQWYPKPAVFDKDGWHQFPYLDQGEFYSEFGSFDVSITVPDNYVVGATGNLQDQSEKLWLDRKADETKAKEKFADTDSFPKSSEQTKTLHYKQDSIHDFAWFCDKRYNVMKSEVKLPHTHRKVTTWVLFTNGQAPLWKDAVKYVNDALYYYSLWNGDYPYNNCTAVDGALSAGGGMEYPTITVISATGDAFELDDVITHEVGHNWFYGILGSNERIHPWMDEGINTYNENRYLSAKYPHAKLIGERTFKHDFFHLNKYPHLYEHYISYVFNAAVNLDQPCELPADQYTKLNYAADVYAKTGLLFNYLLSYLGAETMDKAMQKYYETWKFKHPQPDDLRKIMEEVSGKNLSWFFDDMLKTTKKLDYKMLASKKKEDGSYEITLKNTGEINGTVQVSGLTGDSVRSKIWYEGFEGKKVLNFPAGTYSKFKIDAAENMPEINRNNNSIRTTGIFKRARPIGLQPFVGLDDPDKARLSLLPAIGWNNYNKFMLGALFHNISITEKRFEYVMMPLYGFGNKDLAGYGNVFLNFHPDKLFQKIAIGGEASRYAYSQDPFFMDYSKVAPQISFVFRNKEARNPIKHTLLFRSVTVFMDGYNGDYTFSPPVYSRATTNYTINQLLLTRENARVINPYIVTLDVQQSADFAKASVEAKYSLTFKGKKKSLDMRFFAGTFLSSNSSGTLDTRFRMSGWNGYQDYLYDHTFFGRTETTGVLSQQFVERDGGFKIPVYLGQTNKWLAAVNLKSSLPGILPLKLYADFGITDPDARLNNALLYEAGIDLCVVKDIFEVYFPVLLCSDIKQNLDINNVKYAEQIRFTLNINLLNPFNFIKDFKL